MGSTDLRNYFNFLFIKHLFHGCDDLNCRNLNLVKENFTHLDLNVTSEAEMEYLILMTMTLKLHDLVTASSASLAREREKYLAYVDQGLELSNQLLYSSFSGLSEVRNQLLSIKRAADRRSSSSVWTCYMKRLRCGVKNLLEGVQGLPWWRLKDDDIAPSLSDLSSRIPSSRRQPALTAASFEIVDSVFQKLHERWETRQRGDNAFDERIVALKALFQDASFEDEEEEEEDEERTFPPAAQTPPHSPPPSSLGVIRSSPRSPSTSPSVLRSPPRISRSCPRSPSRSPPRTPPPVTCASPRSPSPPSALRSPPRITRSSTKSPSRSPQQSPQRRIRFCPRVPPRSTQRSPVRPPESPPRPPDVSPSLSERTRRVRRFVEEAATSSAPIGEPSTSQNTRQRALYPTNPKRFSGNSGISSALPTVRLSNLPGRQVEPKRRRKSPEKGQVDLDSKSSISSDSDSESWPASSRSRRPWTMAETSMFVEAICHYGLNWARIKNHAFSKSSRTNVNLKDRYRTLCNQGIFGELYEQAKNKLSSDPKSKGKIKWHP